jgi:5-methylcytosine-specific restriction endonuclease McrA
MSKTKRGEFRYDGFWRKVRQIVLERDDRRCQLRPGCLGEATEVDHIADVAMGGSLYDPDNCRSVCAPCHRRRSNMMRLRTRRPPPAGRGRGRSCRVLRPEGLARAAAGS